MQDHAISAEKMFSDMQNEFNKKEAMDYAAFGDMSMRLLGVNEAALKYRDKTIAKNGL